MHLNHHVPPNPGVWSYFVCFILTVVRKTQEACASVLALLHDGIQIIVHAKVEKDTYGKQLLPTP